MTLPYWTKTPVNEPDWFEALAALARYLRAPGGCPWDRAQTSRDFSRYLCEESKELLAAYEEGPEDNEHIEEEIGDCLFTLLASLVAAEEEGRYTVESALRHAHDKMVRRHAHVFAETPAETPEDAVAAWERVKAGEKRRKAKHPEGGDPDIVDE